jgi:uncharacterized membrane protein YcaP (DUF421 family)
MIFMMLGSIFANAIVDAKSFLPIIVSLFAIIILNSFIKKLVFRFLWVENFIKGPSIELVKNGKINWNEMKANSITKRELLNELASQAHTYDIDKVEAATLASDGSINFIFKLNK